jgi:WD40 repeat protein
VGVLSVSLLVALIGGGVALATAWHVARQAARELRENLYAADIHVAHRAATDGDITRAAALLDAWRPQSGAPDLREFAWYYLRARVHNDPCRVLRGHKALVTALVLSADGERFFSCAEDGDVRAWALSSGEASGVWHVSDKILMDIDRLPDGRLLVAGEAGLQLLDPATGSFNTLRRSPVNAVRAAPDGTTALAGAHRFIFQTDDQLDVVSLDAAPADAAPESEVPALSQSGGRAAFSRDGRLLATGPWHDSIKLWAWPEKMLLGELRPSGTVLSLAFSPDGATLAAAERGGQVTLWDVAQRRIKARLTEHTPRVAWSVAFSPDGSRLVTTGSDQMVRLWDAETYDCIHTYRGHASEVWGAAFSRDGQHIISTSKDATIRIWGAPVVSLPSTPTGVRENTAPVISSDSRLLAVATDARSLAVFEINSWREILRCGGAELPLALTDRGTKLVGLEPGRAIRTWHVPSGLLEKETPLEPVDPPSQRHMLSHDGRWLAGYGGDNDVVIFNAATGKVMARLQGHTNPALCAAFSADDRWLATGAADFTTRLWRISGDGKFSAGPILRGHELTVSDVSFSPDGTLVATASWDDTVRVWSMPDGRERRVFPGHFTGALSVVFLPGSPTIATVNGASALKFWDLRSGRILLDLHGYPDGPADSLVAAPDGTRLFATGNDGRVHVWDARK